MKMKVKAFSLQTENWSLPLLCDFFFSVSHLSSVMKQHLSLSFGCADVMTDSVSVSVTDATDIETEYF